MTDDLTTPTPDESTYKVLRFLTKSLAQFLPPGVSGTASEFFDLVVADPAVKRRDRFMMSLAQRLDELAEKGAFDPMHLLDNEEVSAYLLHAIQIAVRTRGAEKVQALREASVRGTIAQEEADRTPGYVVLGILDRLTDYHIIRLRWEVTPHRAYTYGEVANGRFDSLHYGQPTYSDPKELKQPTKVFEHGGVCRYVEKQSVLNFKLAHADLVAMGLLSPVLKEEAYLDGRRQRIRTTPEIAGYRISDLGRFVVQYIEPVDAPPTPGS